jgi:Na+-driven multidrug efflux pump
LYYAGIALSLSVSVHIVVMVILAHWFDNKESWISRVSWAPSDIIKILTMERLKVFLALAVPTSMTVWLSWWVTEAMVFISAHALTNDKMAALSIILNLTMIMFVEMLGYSMVVAASVGNRLGADEPANAKACARVTIAFGWFLTVCNCVLALIFGKLIFRLYTHEEIVLQHLHSVLWIICLFHLAEGIQIVLQATFRASGKQAKLVPVQAISMWLIAVPLMYITTLVYHLDIPGLLFSFTIGFVLQIPWSLKIISSWDWKVLAHEAYERRVKSNNNKTTVGKVDTEKKEEPPSSSPQEIVMMEEKSVTKEDKTTE